MGLKNFPQKFTAPQRFMEKIYHIYAKDKCLMHSIKEEDFHNTWNNFQHLVRVLDTDYEVGDLSYVEVLTNKEVSLNASY